MKSQLEDLLEFLLKRGLVSPEDIVDSDLELIDKSSRNFNAIVMRNKSTSYFVKRPDSTVAETTRTFHTEAAVYSEIMERQELRSLQGLVPKMITYDPEGNILVMEYLRDYQIFQDFTLSSQFMSAEPFMHLGIALAHFHNVLSNVSKRSHYSEASSRYLTDLPYPSPSSLAYLRHLDFELYQSIWNDPDLVSFLEGCKAEWEENTVIHGDIRWDNLALNITSEDKIKFFDLELAQPGDPAWDVGCIFQNFIQSWLLTFKIVTGKETLEELTSSSGTRLTDIQNCARAFWFSYISNLKIGCQNSGLLDRSIRYSIARLVIAARESLVFADRVPNIAYLLIQASVNLVKEQKKGIHLVLGMSDTKVS